jgi:cell division inhibitor SulA/protein ImuA
MAALPNLAAQQLPSWAARWATGIGIGATTSPKKPSLPMGSPLGELLPGGGFPSGAVVELVSPANLGHGLSVALAACAQNQVQSVRLGGDMAWCAFLDPDRTLFGPAVQASGVRLERLLVLRPPRHLLVSTAVRVASSRLFSVIVADIASVPGAASKEEHRSESMQIWWKAARRLALAVENTNTTVFLLTKSEAHRPSHLPVAMRLELENSGIDGLVVRVAKEKHGRLTQPRQVAWTRPDTLRAELSEPCVEVAAQKQAWSG